MESIASITISSYASISRYEMAQTENSFNSDAGTEDVDIKAIILKYIDKFPGIRYRQLLRVIGFTNGRLEYHLKILESTQKVTVFRRDGRRVGYYPIEFGSDEYQILEHIKNKVARKIVHFILDNALCTFDRILENIKKAPSTLSWHLKRLSEAGIISITYGHRRLQYYRVVNSKLVSGALFLLKGQNDDSYIKIP